MLVARGKKKKLPRIREIISHECSPHVTNYQPRIRGTRECWNHECRGPGVLEHSEGEILSSLLEQFVSRAFIKAVNLQ